MIDADNETNGNENFLTTLLSRMIKIIIIAMTNIKKIFVTEIYRRELLGIDYIMSGII